LKLINGAISKPRKYRNLAIAKNELPEIENISSQLLDSESSDSEKQNDREIEENPSQFL
jgi:hypothetical protein